MRAASLLAGWGVAAMIGLPTLGSADINPVDPLASSRWEIIRDTFLEPGIVRFDERVRVIAPVNAEDPLSVPVAVDASGLEAVQEVVVFADFNPIMKVLRFEPRLTEPKLGFRMKLQQSTPVRAAARTADGVWHLGGVWVKTAGGGCTQASAGSGSREWQERLNQVAARRWPRADGGERLRFRIIHPMDTGFAPGIPVFRLETLELENAKGEVAMRIQPAEPVAENPLFTVDLPAATERGVLGLSGADTNGNLVEVEIAP